MRNVGIHAAMTLAEIGPVSDVKAFFDLVVSLLEDRVRGSKYFFVSDKLYKRSLAYNDLYKVKEELNSIETEFSSIHSISINWLLVGIDDESTRLNLSNKYLSEVFQRLFKAFNEVLECTEAYYQSFKEYIPIRIGFTDAPYYIDDINRSSEQYDALGPEDLPFWLR